MLTQFHSDCLNVPENEQSTTEVEIMAATPPSSCCVSNASCAAISGSLYNPTTCSCLAYYPISKTWDDAYISCQSAAPTGFRGRLPFIFDQRTFDILHTLKTNGYNTWIGLKTTGGTNHTAGQLIFSEWSWYEGNDEITPLTFNPGPTGSNGINVPSSKCIYSGRNIYYDYQCGIAHTIIYYSCEFVNGNK